jgi:osmotically-inducible protein OsmY
VTVVPGNPLTAAVADAVVDRWRASPALDATGLSVALRIDEARIVLRGDTGCHADRTLALEIAEAVAGAGAVLNEITVRPLHLGADDTDGVVAARASAALEDVPGADAVTVSAVDHVVTVHGVVADAATRIACHAAVAHTEGVHFVDDRLTVAAPPTP